MLSGEGGNFVFVYVDKVESAKSMKKLVIQKSAIKVVETSKLGFSDVDEHD